MALQVKGSTVSPIPLIYQVSMVSLRILQLHLYLKNAIILLIYYTFQVNYYNYEFLQYIQYHWEMKIKKCDIFEIRGQILYQGISSFCKRSDMQYSWKNLGIILTWKYRFSSKEYALYKMKLFNSKRNPVSQTFQQWHVA